MYTDEAVEKLLASLRMESRIKQTVMEGYEGYTELKTIAEMAHQQSKISLDIAETWADRYHIEEAAK
jgi:hypothetical protein